MPPIFCYSLPLNNKNKDDDVNNNNNNNKDDKNESRKLAGYQVFELLTLVTSEYK
jgi:hypothetical protein